MHNTTKCCCFSWEMMENMLSCNTYCGRNSGAEIMVLVTNLLLFRRLSKEPSTTVLRSSQDVQKSHQKSLLCGTPSENHSGMANFGQHLQLIQGTNRDILSGQPLLFLRALQRDFGERDPGMGRCHKSHSKVAATRFLAEKT